MADLLLPTKAPFIGSEYTKNLEKGYDSSFLKLNRRPNWSVDPIEGVPGVLTKVSALYLTTAEIGKKEADPRRSWNGVIGWINRRLGGPYTSSASGFDSDSLGAKVTTVTDFGLFGTEYKLENVKNGHIWTIDDIRKARDRLRILQPWMKFSPIPRVWSKKIIDELYKMCWVRQTTTFTNTFTGVPPGNPDHQDFTFQDVREAFSTGFASYGYDMDNGLGGQFVTWPSTGFPTSTEALLNFWAEQDRFEDAAPKVRGKATFFLKRVPFVHAEGNGEQTSRFEFFGDTPDYMVPSQLTV